MTTTVNIHEAKTHLSRLLANVAAGDEVIIARNGEPVARLVSVNVPQPRKPGRFRGQISGVESLLESEGQEDVEAWLSGHEGDPLRSSNR